MSAQVRKLFHYHRTICITEQPLSARLCRTKSKEEVLYIHICTWVKIKGVVGP